MGYVETSDLCSGRPVFSNGRYKLYCTNPRGQDDSVSADRWHINIESASDGCEVAFCAKLDPGDIWDIDSGGWHCRVDGGWQADNGRFACINDEVRAKMKVCCPLKVDRTYHSSLSDHWNSGTGDTVRGIHGCVQKAYTKHCIQGFVVWF